MCIDLLGLCLTGLHSAPTKHFPSRSPSSPRTVSAPVVNVLDGRSYKIRLGHLDQLTTFLGVYKTHCSCVQMSTGQNRPSVVLSLVLANIPNIYVWSSCMSLDGLNTLHLLMWFQRRQNKPKKPAIRVHPKVSTLLLQESNTTPYGTIHAYGSDGRTICLYQLLLPTRSGR